MKPNELINLNKQSIQKDLKKTVTMYNPTSSSSTTTLNNNYLELKGN